MDRLGFWGLDPDNVIGFEPVFQYPLMDRLGFWGNPGAQRQSGRHEGISVSADGSTWFLGRRVSGMRNTPTCEFQYPLMDRLGFWGHQPVRVRGVAPQFQYPLMDRLGFWGSPTSATGHSSSNFSIR